MSNPFSSALSYLGYGGGDKGVSEAASRFVGQVVDLGGESKLKVRKVIAEGGYGYVFIAQDTHTGVEYALKRQVVSKENVKIVKREIAYLKQLRDHPHVINYVASAGIPPSHTSHGSAEFLIQTELCSGGKMEDVLRGTHLTPGQVLRVFYAACSAVAHMHSRKPPIIHRDIKVENLLLSDDGVIKLCDFGSATNEQLHPDTSWTSIQRGLAEDEIQRNTTPMYRSPEMVDLYSNKPINEPGDVWALGCMLYLLCFRTHPFEDSGKLRIINANYKIPEADNTFVMFHKMIAACLVVDPTARPSVDALLAQLFNIADQLRENMEQPSLDLLNVAKQSSDKTQEGVEGGDSESSDGGGAMSAALQSTSQQAHKLFGFMKEGAGSLLKNIKDSSSKALNAMSSASPRRGDLDITYVTSRILAMSYPHEDSFHSHNITEVRTFLEERHPSAYLIFNLTDNHYDPVKVGNQVYDFPWPHRGVVPMEKMVDLCRGMDSWLRAEKDHVVVIHCQDGISITPLAIVSYLLFLRVVSSPLAALNFVALKRRPESPVVTATPSQLRYLEAMVRLVNQQPPYKPHSCKLAITMLRLTSVPLFNAIKTGCKPFVEVYQEGERVYTSASQDSMDSIRSFHSDDHCVEIPLGVTVQGNVNISVYHIRAIPVARKAGMGMTAVKMFYFCFHTGFMDIQQTSLTFDRKNLDGSAVRKGDKFPSPFSAVLEVDWDLTSVGVLHEASWQNLPYPKSSPVTCFSSTTEQSEVIKLIDPKKSAVIGRRLPDVPVTPTSPPAQNLIPLLSQHPHQPSPNLVDIQEEEKTSAGGGNLMGGANLTPGEQAAAQAGQDFFSQLEWQENQNAVEEFGGYMQFEDQVPVGKVPRRTSSGGSSTSSSSSSSGASSSGDDGLNFQAISYGAPVENLYAQPSKLKVKKSDNASSEGQGRGGVEMEKLIEVSTEEDIQSIQLGTSNNASSSKGSLSNQSKGPTGQPDAFAGVVFDPWGTLSPPDENGDEAGSGGLNVDEMFGLGVSDDSKTAATITPSTATVVGGPDASKTQNTSSNLGTFDPFGSTQTTNQSSFDPFSTNLSASFSGTFPSNGNTGNNSGGTSNGSSNKVSHTQNMDDPFGMLGETSLLAPTQSPSTLSPESPAHDIGQAANTPQGAGSHRHSEPFAEFGSFLAPTSASTGSASSSARKMSTPVPQQFAKSGQQQQQQQQQQVGGMYGRSSLAPSQPPKASLSHPNLSLAGQNHPMQPNLGMGRGAVAASSSGWSSSTSYGGAAGRGSVSHNSSPRRSPSPMGVSRSTENVSMGEQQRSASFDPFQQFNIKSMSGQPQGSMNTQGQGTAARNGMGTASATNSSGLPPTGNSYRPYYMQSQAGQPGVGGQQRTTNGVGGSRSNGAVPTKQGGAGGGGGAGVKPKTSSVFHHRPQSPNYNPSYGGGNKTGMPSKPKSDAFGDLLGSGFNPKKSTESKTLKDMKSNQDIANSLDPERARVAAWAERKERNIRAILSSLHEILWEGETRWHEVGMHQLVQPEQVSKFYRKACLSVHPDKAQGTDHETLARAIFDELNDAYAKFEASGSRPLY